MAALQLFEGATSQGAKRLQRSPAQLLLLPQGGMLADQPVVLPVETLAIRALAGLFWHRVPLAVRSPSWHQKQPVGSAGQRILAATGAVHSPGGALRRGRRVVRGISIGFPAGCRDFLVKPPPQARARARSWRPAAENSLAGSLS